MEKLINAFEQNQIILQYMRDLARKNNIMYFEGSEEAYEKYGTDFGDLANIVISYIESKLKVIKTLALELEDKEIELRSIQSKIDKGEFSVEFTPEAIDALQKRFSFETTVCACGSNCTCQCGK